MPAFEYRSLDHRGKINKGTLEADSARQVRQQLRDKGWVPLEVNEASDTNSQGPRGLQPGTQLRILSPGVSRNVPRHRGRR